MTGFFLSGDTNTCSIGALKVYSRPEPCSVSFDLTAVNGKTQNVITDPLKDILFEDTPVDCGTSTFEYQVTYTSTVPSSTNLISMPSPTVKSIRFG